LNPVAVVPDQAKNANIRASMLARGGASAGVAGSSKEV
jgi:hypothetical protein